MPNMKNLINSRNLNILNNKITSTWNYNHNKNSICPFNRECLLKNVYKANVCYVDGCNEYIGSTGVYFKSRFINQHTYSTNSNTARFIKVCQQKQKKDINEVRWSIVYKTRQNTLKKSANCSILILERMAIVQGSASWRYSRAKFRIWNIF